MFSTHLDNFLPFSSNLKLSSANSFSLEESKICLLVMGKLLSSYVNLMYCCTLYKHTCLLSSDQEQTEEDLVEEIRRVRQLGFT